MNEISGDTSADDSEPVKTNAAKQDPPSSGSKPAKPQPAPVKIPEPPDNLTRRSNWFRRRSGN